MFSEALADFVASIIIGFMGGVGWYLGSCILNNPDSNAAIRFGGLVTIFILAMIGTIQIRQNWNKTE